MYTKQKIEENHALRTENLSTYKDYNDDNIFLQQCDIGIEINVLSSEEYIIINELDYAGRCCCSDNGEYLISWCEKRGVFLLIRNGVIILKGIMQRPYTAYVSNNGSAIIVDSPLNRSGKLFNWFYVISSDGQVVIADGYYANVGGVSISDDDLWAVCQTYQAKQCEDHSNKIFVYDLNNRVIISKFSREVDISRKSRINSLKQEIFLIYGDRKYPFLILRYTFDGELLDRSIWRKYCEDIMSGFELSFRASELLKKISSDKLDDYAEPVRLLSLSLKRDISINTKAYIFRYLGDIFRNCKINQKAIMLYEESLKYNPKMSVKRSLKKLKQSLK